MQTSERGMDALRSEEGEVLRAYRCPAGVLTIGVELTKASGVVDPKPGMIITKAESRALLQKALARNYEPRVRKRGLTRSQHEFDGSVMFDFNTGRIHSASWGSMWLHDNEFRGIHRTAIAPDGSGKADVHGLGNPRKMLGDAKGACVKLCPDEDVTLGLGLTDGVETGLAVMSLGYRPLWAALSASAMAQFAVLAGVGTLTLFADNDASGAGQRAADVCADRWVAQGRECVFRTPPEIGSDFNDLVAKGTGLCSEGTE